MSFNLFPKSVIEGRTSSGKTFRAFEYDFSTFINLQLISIICNLIIGFLICSIISPIILIMIMLTFNGRFNFLYLLIPLFSGYFLLDVFNDWFFIMLLKMFISDFWLKILVSVNITSIISIIILTIFGEYIVNKINGMTKDLIERYIIFFFIMIIIITLTMKIALNFIII